MEEKWSWVEGSHGMRTALLDALTDADLAFNPGGANMTLGALIREMGDVEQSYLQSLKTLKQSFNERNTEVGLEGSIARLKAWFQALDDEMKNTLSAFSDEDMQKTIERDSGFSLPVEMQMDIYLQALLIFFGKASIFLKAMNKPLPDAIRDYIW